MHLLCHRWGRRAGRREEQRHGHAEGKSVLQVAVKLALFRLLNFVVFRGAPGHVVGPEAHLPGPEQHPEEPAYKITTCFAFE